MHLYDSVNLTVGFKSHAGVVESDVRNYFSVVVEGDLGSVCLVALLTSVDQYMVACYVYHFIHLFCIAVLLS